MVSFDYLSTVLKSGWRVTTICTYTESEKITLGKFTAHLIFMVKIWNLKTALVPCILGLPKAKSLPPTSNQTCYLLFPNSKFCHWKFTFRSALEVSVVFGMPVFSMIILYPQHRVCHSTNLPKPESWKLKKEQPIFFFYFVLFVMITFGCQIDQFLKGFQKEEKTKKSS